MQGISVVIPVFQSRQTIGQVVQRTVAHLSRMECRFEIILVDDGSDADTWTVVKAISDSNPLVHAMRLGRNYGQHSAILAGIRRARFPITVTLDDDLQNPPEEISKLAGILLRSNSFDVVYGVPEVVAQSRWRRVSGLWIRRILGKTMGVGEATSMSSFRAFRTNLRDGFQSNLGPGVSIDSLLAWTTDAFGSITVDHRSRTNGKSNYSFRKLTLFAVDTITGYSTLPLRIASLLGLVTATGGVFLLAIFVLWPVFRGNSVEGFPFLASTIILFSGIQLITLGVIGEYLAKMHFRIMSKPEYFVVEDSEIDSIQ